MRTIIAKIRAKKNGHRGHVNFPNPQPYVALYATPS